MAFLRWFLGFVCAFIFMIILAEVFKLGKEEWQKNSFAVSDELKKLENRLDEIADYLFDKNWENGD